MVFQWFCYPLTITIEFFFHRLTIAIEGFSMVSPNSGTMVNNGFGPFERPKKACNRDISLTNARDDRESG